MTGQGMLSIFDTKETAESYQVCIRGIEKEIRDLINFLGGFKKAAKLSEIKSSYLKEGCVGRTAVSLGKLYKLICLLDDSTKRSVIKQIDSKELYLRFKRSKHTVKFPDRISPDLCYVIGLILGDGHLAGDSLNKKGNWYVSVFFDNLEHLKAYKNKIEKIFEITPKFYRPQGENYYDCYFGSKAVHWYLRSYFGLHNGRKDDKIVIPTKIIKSEKKELIVPLIRGLFDSDGTIISKQPVIKFSSTSEKIVDQLMSYLPKLGILAKKYMWLKNEKCKPLYTLQIKKKECITKFANKINFEHPSKKKKLYNLYNTLSN